MTSKINSLRFDFWHHFLKIKAHQAILRKISHILATIPQILAGFSPNQNFWGCACPPATRTPTSLFSDFDIPMCFMLLRCVASWFNQNNETFDAVNN